MKRKLLCLLVAVLTAFCLAACGETAETREDEPKRPEGVNEGDELLHEEPFTLCKGRTATLRLYGRHGEYDDGVSAIVLDWTDGTQTVLLVSDIEDDPWAEDGYTQTWDAAAELMPEDCNFDGYTDIGLQIAVTAYNRPYFYWFYHAETGTFEPYGSWPCPLEIDERAQEATCEWHATPEYYLDTYRADGSGGLYLAARRTTASHDG